jgi:hypothetical protein
MCREGMTDIVSDIFPVIRTIDEQIDAVDNLEINGKS